MNLPAASRRLPVAGERVEYRASVGSTLYTGTATGKPCDDRGCGYIHVLSDGGGMHHIDPAYFLRPGAAGRFARVVAGKSIAEELVEMEARDPKLRELGERIENFGRAIAAAQAKGER